MPSVSSAGSLKRQQASQVAGFTAAAIAAIALIGWWAKLPILSSWGASFAATEPVTALCLTALGLALVPPGKNVRVAFAIGLLVAGVATVDLVLDLAGVELGIGHALMLRAAAPGPEAASLVDITPIAIALAGGSLALSRFDRHHFAAAALSSFAGVMAAFAVLGYLTGIYTLYGSAPVNSPALPAAVGLLCVVASIVLRTEATLALRKPRPLWQLLVMLGCAIVTPLLLFCAYAGFRIADAQLRDDLDDLTIEARSLSAGIEREIVGEIERLQALAASASLRQLDFAEFQRQAEASLALSQSGNIMLVDRSMQQLVNTWVPFGEQLPKAPVPETVERALTTGKPQVTGLFVGPVIKQLLIGIIVPVQIDGESRYALVRSPNLQALARLVTEDALPAGWHAVVSDATHRIIARSKEENGFIGQELPPSQWHLAAPDGVFEFVDSEGRPSLEAHAGSELTGWETAVWAPKALLEAPGRALWWSLGYIALLAFAMVVTLALWLGRIIARSVGHAARAAIASGQDGAVLPSDTPVAEINALMAELRERTDLLREREQQVRIVTDSVQVAIAHVDTEARYKFVNRHYAERRGLTPEQVVGKSILEVVGKKAWATFEPYFRKCLAGEAIEFEIEIDLPCRADEPQFVHCSYEPEWRDGKIVGLVAAITNVTGLKRAEQRLRASEVTFRQLVENSPFGIYVVDADFRIAQVSAGAKKKFENVWPLIGRDLAEVMRCIWPEPFANDAIGRFCRTLDAGEPYHSRASVERRKDTGAVEAYDWQLERVTMPDGRFGVVCRFYDLSERQKYEAALRESEATFRAMFEVSSVGKIEVEPASGRFLRANAAMCNFVGYSEAELLARTVYDITHADHIDSDRELCRGVDAGESAFDEEKRYIRKDGNVVWARTTVNVIYDESGRPSRHIGVIQDLNARKQAELDLQASKDRLQLALDAAQLGWWQADPHHRTLSGDARSKEIFDIAADETPTEEIRRRVHPDDAERYEAARETLDSTVPKSHAMEFRLQRGDGEVRWVDVHWLTNFEGDGRERRAVSVVGTVADITERREREEKEHLLMREINHRAKNMLSVVHAIARQTAAKNSEDFIARFSERIQALSANHDLLVRNEWNGVEIEDLVRAQLAPFADLIGPRIVVHGPRLCLKATSAQAVGLVLHELATNAGKYGALSTDRGCVNVCWGTEGNTFNMSWIESDGPAVFAPERRGFGTMVMEAMAEHSVDGTVSLDYAPSGVTWRLICPAANALEPGEREQRARGPGPAAFSTPPPADGDARDTRGYYGEGAIQIHHKPL